MSTHPVIVLSAPWKPSLLETCSSLFHPHAWVDARITLSSSCMLLGFLMRPLKPCNGIRIQIQTLLCQKYILNSISHSWGNIWNREWFIQLMELTPCIFTSLFHLKMSIIYNIICFYWKFNKKWLLWSSVRIATVKQKDPYQTTEAMKYISESQMTFINPCSPTVIFVNSKINFYYFLSVTCICQHPFLKLLRSSRTDKLN